MKYSDGRAPVKTDDFCGEFFEQHGEFTGLSQNQFVTLIGLSSERYESLPYHGYTHPMQVMRDAALLAKSFNLKLLPDTRAGLIVGAAYHDLGESYPAEERQYKTPEDFSADTMREDQAEIGLDERVLDIARKCILATAPGKLKHSGVEARILVRADIANVTSNNFERMADATRSLVDECMLKVHQDHDDFLIETFIRNSLSMLDAYLKRDLHIHPKDDWNKISTRAFQAIHTQIPAIARNHFEDVARSLGQQMQNGVYPYTINQGSSSVITPEPWLGSPDPSTTS